MRSASILEAFVVEARSLGLRVVASPIDDGARRAALSAAGVRGHDPGPGGSAPCPAASPPGSPHSAVGALVSPASGGTARPPLVDEVVEAMATLVRPGSPAQRAFGEYEGGMVELDVDWGGELFGSQVMHPSDSGEGISMGSQGGGS